MKISKTNLPAIFAIMLFFTGCSATGPLFKDAKAPSDKCGLVYIYRPDSYVAVARKASFHINENKVINLSNKGYTAFYLPTGDYLLKQKWPSDMSKKVIEIPFTLVASKTFYFRIKTSVGANSIIWNLSHPNVAKGRSEISVQRYQEPNQKSLATLGSAICK